MSIDEKPFKEAWNATVNTPSAPEDTYEWALWGYRIAMEAKANQQPVENTALAEDVEEYLHWRKVNPQIKGGENYLKRFRQSLATREREYSNRQGLLDSWQPVETVPKDGRRILLGRLEDGEIVNITDDFWYQDRVMGGFDDYAEVFDEPPTHWLPIPEIPRRG